MQAEESVEDFIVKALKNNLSAKQFEQFMAALLRSMGYFARVTPYGGDGGIDIIAHKDELGFQPPVIKVQCKQTFATIGGPDVQQYLEQYSLTSTGFSLPWATIAQTLCASNAASPICDLSVVPISCS